MLVEQDTNCNQPLTEITGTDFVFYLENYLFAFAAIFFFFLLPRRFFFSNLFSFQDDLRFHRSINRQMQAKVQVW